MAADIRQLEIENHFKALALKINDITLKFTRKADENDHLFGSVSENDIVKSLAEKGIEIGLKQLEVGDYVLSKRVCVELKGVSDFVNSLHVEPKPFPITIGILLSVIMSICCNSFMQSSILFINTA